MLMITCAAVTKNILNGAVHLNQFLLFLNDFEI